MQYCTKCGAKLEDGVRFCPECGAAAVGAPVTAPPSPAEKNEGLDLAIKVFMVIGCFILAWSLIGLIWSVPMTVYVFKQMKNGGRISVGFKICTLLFVNVIAGILLLVREDSNNN